MAAEKLRRRQVEQSVVVLIDEPSAFLARRPMLAGGAQRRPRLAGARLDHFERGAALRRDDDGNAVLEDAGLLGGDRLERLAEKFGVIERRSA